jgi:glycosyltransferase involved in cell wall biosynthesis
MRADAVIYVDGDLPEQMVAALGRLLGDAELRHALSERGKRRAQEFSRQIAARMLLGIMHALVHPGEI